MSDPVEICIPIFTSDPEFQLFSALAGVFDHQVFEALIMLQSCGALDTLNRNST